MEMIKKLREKNLAELSDTSDSEQENYPFKI